MAWSSIGNIKGPTGTQGPQGPTGPASTVPGPQGPAGATGPPGPTQVSGDAANTAMLGSDNLLYVPTLPLATTTKIGALQKLSGNATDVLNGTNAFGPVPLATNANQGGIIALSQKATDFLDGTNHFQAIWKGFIAKTAAYTLTAADSGKYIICSGGSWTLTLPAPTVGLLFQVRNDMGISGTTGNITLQPTGGTIDGQASISLLPQQECTLITDGSNWRTLGLKREVILGTQDITTPTASSVILLPVGYRYFQLELDQIAMDTDAAAIAFQLSTNSGSTWLSSATSYLEGVVYDSTATVAAYQSAAANNASLSCAQTTLAINHGGGSSRLRLNPGSATIAATWSLTSGGWSSAANRLQSFYTQGSYNSAPAGVMNALKYFASVGNITRSFLTVKGVV